MSTDIANSALSACLTIEGGYDMSAVQAAVRTFARPLGYDRFVLFSAKPAREDVIERIYWVEGDWFGDGEAVDVDTYIRRCPVTRHILEVTEPFFWIKTNDAAGELYRVVSTPNGEGVHGLQIPVFGPLGLEGAMSLGGKQIDHSPAARLTLSNVASAAFVAARRLLETEFGAEAGRLSPREREVLAWTAAGRRQTEIAETLRLSARTVENHLRRIRRRLGVTTTAQAIRIAIRNGYIEG